jgi:hypothetical protein
MKRGGVEYVGSTRGNGELRVGAGGSNQKCGEAEKKAGKVMAGGD